MRIFLALLLLAALSFGQLPNVCNWGGCEIAEADGPALPIPYVLNRGESYDFTVRFEFIYWNEPTGPLQSPGAYGVANFSGSFGTTFDVLYEAYQLITFQVFPTSDGGTVTYAIWEYKATVKVGDENENQEPGELNMTYPALPPSWPAVTAMYSFTIAGI